MTQACRQITFQIGTGWDSGPDCREYRHSPFIAVDIDSRASFIKRMAIRKPDARKILCSAKKPQRDNSRAGRHGLNHFEIDCPLPILRPIRERRIVRMRDRPIIAGANGPRRGFPRPHRNSNQPGTSAHPGPDRIPCATLARRTERDVHQVNRPEAAVGPHHPFLAAQRAPARARERHGIGRDIRRRENLVRPYHRIKHGIHPHDRAGSARPRRAPANWIEPPRHRRSAASSARQRAPPHPRHKPQTCRRAG